MRLEGLSRLQIQILLLGKIMCVEDIAQLQTQIRFFLAVGAVIPRAFHIQCYP